MWTFQTELSAEQNRLHVVLHGRSAPLTNGDVIAAWRDDAAFRAFWIAALRDISEGAYAWEMPPLTRQALSRPFECVFIDAPWLTGPAADPAPFAAHFARPDPASCRVFASLGGDAHLVAPCPNAAGADYAHLASFIRTAPPAQAGELWQTLASAFTDSVSDVPLWLSTAGHGVAWLHLRIDTRRNIIASALTGRRISGIGRRQKTVLSSRWLRTDEQNDEIAMMLDCSSLLGNR